VQVPRGEGSAIGREGEEEGGAAATFDLRGGDLKHELLPLRRRGAEVAGLSLLALPHGWVWARRRRGREPQEREGVRWEELVVERVNESVGRSSGLDRHGQLRELATVELREVESRTSKVDSLK